MGVVMGGVILMMHHALAHHLSMCRLVNTLLTAERVKSLNPHWVSRIPLTQRKNTKKWNPYIKKLRKNDLWGRGEGDKGVDYSCLTLATASSSK